MALIPYPLQPARVQQQQQQQHVRSCSLTMTPQRSPQPLRMSRRSEANDEGRQFAASVLASAYILTGILTSSTAAKAVTTTDQVGAASTLMLSARTGGRIGGRSASRPAFRAPSRVPGSATSRRYGQAIIVRPTPVLSPGFGLVSPFGYGYGYGALGAASVINEGIREARQESELRDERVELEQVRQREAEMEQRIKLLEQQQQMQQKY
jgi:hypothetical protein